ncbi:UDP-glucose 6-dehydrogenase TuaD [Clostridium homopropionicum DSM 5847]|uniref:UDP-glucose 6-dehydrogenase n=1 Tax=Clostridium homopropionicum DSM 5847 TaxID=1121318 RepID=A0A0L6Z659_9CLOT|nr:UDP-glucose/GDP-mannose dehydrogenase family protein [Clostridium homopropionicum]KOA18457.1 UDP-glucose 6-dehydrogenase TuaD [Clostridium homopropionicum DSM 5847]SFF66455.1 UDP-glucose dehydrogenase [Clostridium homopropionicum]
MIKIAIIGSGYVGLVTAICLSDFGWRVTCVDKNEEIISQLNKGIPPIYEPNLNDMLLRNLHYRRIDFTTHLKQAVIGCDVIFIAVGTPENEDGSADLTNVFEVAREIGQSIDSYKIVVDKSTVPIGTGQMVKKIIREEIDARGLNINFDVVSNPEFLRQGSAIQDFTHADRVVIGAESQHAIEVMKEVYRVLYINETPFLIVNIETAEMVKYASNAFLATKISFVNELSELCERVGANIQQVSKGMGMDGRIGSKFLHAGPGYGGSCFPKDTKALVHIGEMQNCNLGIIKATIEANEKQKHRMVDMMVREMGSLKGKCFGVLGLAFKNSTDDIRESPSLTILRELAMKGSQFKVYDPKAMKKASQWFATKEIPIIKYCEDEYEAAEDVDAIILITEWNQFRSLNVDRIKSNMRDDYFFDLRNIYSKEAMNEKGFKYFSVGRI